MKGIQLWIAATMLLGAIVSSAAPASAADPQIIDLEFTTQSNAQIGWNGLSLDKDGKLEIPFANAAGKLTFQVKDGKLQVDTHGDGVIEEKDSSAMAPKNVTIRVAANVGGRTVRFPYRVQIATGQYLFLSPRGMLEGKFGSNKIRLYPNLHGHFGRPDTYLSWDAGDHRSYPWMPWSTTLVMNGQLYQTELLGDGKQLTLTRYSGPVAEVKLQVEPPGTTASVMLCELNHKQAAIVSSRESASFIPGQYRIDDITLAAAGQGGSGLSGRHEKNAGPLELQAGANTLKVGGPFKLDFVATRDGDQIEFTAAAVQGVAGESYRLFIQEQQGDSCAAFIRAGGKEQQLTKLGFG